MHEKRILKNYLYTMVGQMLNLVIPLITTPYISRVLGATNIGIYSYTLSISTYFIVAGSLGFPLYGQREVAFVSHDKEKLSHVFFKVLYAQLALLTITLLAYYTAVCFVFKENRMILILQSIGIIGGVFATSWFYYGIEQFKVTVAKNMFVKLFSTICIFLFVKTNSDLPAYTSILSISNVVGNLIILVDAKKYVDFKQCRVRVSDIIASIKPALILGIPYYITSIYAVIDRTMLGSMGSGYSEVGYYEQSQKVILLLMTVITSIGTVMLPRIANDIGQNNTKNAINIINKGVEIVLLISVPLCLGLIAIGDMIVPWFFGVGYEKVGTLIRLFAPLMIINGVSNLIGNQYLVAQKKEKELTISILISIVINLSLNWMLIPKYDSIGATIATIVAETVKIVVQICMVSELDHSKHVISLLRYIGYSVVMGGCVYLIRIKLLHQMSFLNCIMLAMAGGIVYFILLLIFKDKYLSLIYEWLRKKR